MLRLVFASLLLSALAACGGDDGATPTPLGGSTVSPTASPTPATSLSGNVITSPDTSGTVGGHTALALDGSGNPVVSYFDFTNNDLRILHCGDPNCSSGNAITSPDTAGDVGKYTSLVLDSSGNPVVTYWDETNGDLKMLRCGDPRCGSGNVITAPDAAGRVGEFTSLALDDSGNPVVSYFDFTTSALKVLHCGDANCSAGNVITLPDTENIVGEHTSLVLDAGGNPVISYHAFSLGDLKVLHCGDPSCSSGNVITSPDTAGNVGTFTSLVLDGSGNPVVSYFDGPNIDLKVLHCGDPNCSSGNVITSPDTAGDVGLNTSLALDGSGNPVVSYQNGTSGELKLLYCGDPSCSSGNVITSPGATGIGSSSSPSLALDGSGNPVVSYPSDRDLKILHCGDPNCGVPPTDAD